MSDEMYDDDELKELYEDYEDADQLTPEEVFTMVTLNRNKKVTVKAELRDENGDIVSLVDTIEKILEFMKDKLHDTEGNQFVDQIMPLMSQSVVSGLGRIVGIPETALMLANNSTKTGVLYMMCTAFLLLKFVQNNKLKIFTYEDTVTDEEIEAIDRKVEANKMLTYGTIAGMNPQEILDKLYEEGKITKEDLESMLGKNKVL